jgi:hypothetical protein
VYDLEAAGSVSFMIRMRAGMFSQTLVTATVENEGVPTAEKVQLPLLHPDQSVFVASPGIWSTPILIAATIGA